MRASTIVILLAACGPSTTNQSPTTVGTTPSETGLTYRIQLERPPEIGRSYRVMTATHSRQGQTFTQDGAEPQSAIDDKRVELVGVMQRTGELTYWVDVDAFEVRLGESVQQPIGEGTRLEVTRGEPGEISMNGQVLTGDLAEWVGLVVADGPPRDEDALYGTPNPQPIGGTWNFSPDVVSELLARMRVQVPTEAIHGGFQIVELEPEPVDALRVRGVLEMDTLDFPQMPNATVESGSVRVAMEWLLPTDLAQVSPLRSMEMRMNARMRIEDPESGDSGILTMEFHLEREARLSPI